MAWTTAYAPIKVWVPDRQLPARPSVPPGWRPDRWPPQQVDPGYGVEAPIDPGFGVDEPADPDMGVDVPQLPGFPGFPGGRPTLPGGRPSRPQRPAQMPSLPDGWEWRPTWSGRPTRPGRPVDPGFGVEEPVDPGYGVPGDYEPGVPEQPIAPPGRHRPVGGREGWPIIERDALADRLKSRLPARPEGEPDVGAGGRWEWIKTGASGASLPAFIPRPGQPGPEGEQSGGSAGAWVTIMYGSTPAWAWVPEVAAPPTVADTAAAAEG